MPKNITYLLGAGASANALPTINEINSRLVLFRNPEASVQKTNPLHLVENTLDL